MLSGLEDYPCLDENVLSELERQDEQEAWESAYKCDFMKKLEEQLEGEEMVDNIREIIENDWEGKEGVLLEVFELLKEETNTYWEHECEGPYISLDRLFDVELEVLVSTIEQVINKD